MDTLITILIGLYVFFESVTALNEMKRARLRHALDELKNPYYIKYSFLGLYALMILAHAHELHGWFFFLPLPAVLCVFGRTRYRIKMYQGLFQ